MSTIGLFSANVASEPREAAWPKVKIPPLLVVSQ
jgi:hypothetical protein